MKRFGGWNNASKYGASKVTYKGITFDSRYERDRYIYLCQLQKDGKISNLRLQTQFLLIPQVTKFVEVQLKTKVRYDARVVEMAAYYHNDFTYKEDDKYVCEEFKSEMTSKLPDYILRRKLMVQKIYAHNKKCHGKWIFREVIYKNKKITITDK